MNRQMRRQMARKAGPSAKPNAGAIAQDALRRLGQGDVAGAAQGFARAQEMEPHVAGYASNLGVCLKRLGRHDEAAQAFLRSIELAPADPDLPYNLGNLLLDMGQPAMAVQQFARAIELRPAHAQAMINLGSTLLALDHVAEAQEVLRMAVRLSPNHLPAIVNLAVVCDFEAYRAFAAMREGDEPLLPGLYLHFEDDPARQLARSRRYAKARFLPATPLAPPAPDARLRVGFLSADYHDHATMRLIAGLLRSYDTSRFAFHALSYGPDRQDEWRAFAMAHHQGFRDISALSDPEAVAAIRALALDILIDLKGFTKDSRSHLLGARLAPVQAAWLGYPGSMGHPAVDYALVDQATVPPALRHGFDEALVYLPHSYQPNDNQRAIIPDAGTRADHGLPAQGFVFCSFNHAYKISPAEFNVWMRLLGGVEGSVFWLLRSNAVVERNLRAEAAARGIMPDRLIFAEARQHNAHLGRIAHADLFLDSFAVNAHTTASDALWAGLPVLTMAGGQFAARVGASLLGAVGLDELITTSPAEYEALALALARDRERLGQLRHRLAQARQTCPLFDTTRFTRSFEAALMAMHERHRAGLPPADITIPAP
jgi:predicted O-linked N-acetylglucosamine transferase (SPINDLY family)